MFKSTTFISKSALIIFALAVESFFVTNLLFAYVQTKNYFSPDLQDFVLIAVLFLLILLTYSLSVGGWGKWEQYILVPLPISIGIFLAIFNFDQILSLLIATLAFTLISYDIYIATETKKDLIRFRPRIILNRSARGILFTFSLVTAILVFLYSTTDGLELNVGREIGSFADKYYGNLLEGFPLQGISLSQIVELEFNRLVAPYRDFIPPLVALLVFTFVRFVGGISNLAFTLTAKPVFWLFKKIGFLKVSHTSVEKEEIGFESAKT